MEGYRFVVSDDPEGGHLTVRLGSKRLLRIPGNRFFAPDCEGDAPATFHDHGNDYLVLGERSLDDPLRGVWHVFQTAPRLRYVQGIRSRPDADCPLLVFPASGADSDISLEVRDTTMCGFDSDTKDCELAFTIWYDFVRGEFRPNYSTDGTPPDWEYIRTMANYMHLETTPEGKLAPVEFWKMVLELVTEGHASAATDFIDYEWREERPGRSEAVWAFMVRLRTSPHYRGMVGVNRGAQVCCILSRSANPKAGRDK